MFCPVRILPKYIPNSVLEQQNRPSDIIFSDDGYRRGVIRMVSVPLSSTNTASITLLGCGKMGSAMLRLWIDRKTVTHAHIIDPSPLPECFRNIDSVTYSSSYNPSSPINSDFFVLAVKPQILDNTLAPIAQYISSECCVLSIAAGKDMATLSRYFDKKQQPIIRVMPNTPASIGQGAIVAITNKMVGWHPAKYLFEQNLITFDDTDE